MWYLYFSCLLAWNASHDQQITLSYINYLIKRRGLCACQLFYETTMDKHFILCDLYYGWYVHPNLLHGVIPPLLNYTASTFPSEVSVCDRCRWGFFRGGGGHVYAFSTCIHWLSRETSGYNWCYRITPMNCIVRSSWIQGQAQLICLAHSIRWFINILKGYMY